MIQNIFGKPEAYAQVRGSMQNAKIHGNIYFYGMHNGTLVIAEVYGLPNTIEKENGNFYGFHIHERESCTGDEQDTFKNVGGHYNPEKETHPKHAGDLPPLLANDGIAWSAVYTDRFYPEDVVGRTVIIHGMEDDFHTQPSGDSGMKIACGEIVV